MEARRRSVAPVALGAVRWCAAVTAAIAAALAAPPISPVAAVQASPAAHAQESPSPALSLVRQPAWTAVGGELPLRLKVDDGRPGLDLRFTLHGRLSSRTAFERTTLGEGLGSTLARIDLALDDQPTTRDGEVVATLGLRGSDRSGSGLLPATHTGVYPMEVELIDPDTGDALSAFVTWLVAVEPEPIDAPLSVAWIWQIGAPPLDRSDGTPDPDVLSQLLPGGRLDRIATSLATARGVPLTLAISPETLESWRDAAVADPRLSDGFEALRGAASRDEHQLLPAPYVPIDIPAIEASGLGDELVPELLAGADALEQILGRRVDPRTAFVEPVDAPALVRLRRSFVDRVAVREEALLPVERNLTPARPFTLAADDLTLRAASTNPGLYSLLDGPESVGLRAQRFLAGMSLVALEAPSSPRGLVFANPPDWDPDPSFMRTVLAGLRDHPLLAARTLDDYFTATPDDTFDDTGEPMIRLLGPSEPGEFPVSMTAYADARVTLDSFRTVVGSDDDSILRGERALLVALTTEWTAARAAEELSVINDAAAEFLGRISTTEQRVTLTARRAEIPLSFRNDTGRPVRVRVRLASSKLLFPDGPEKVVELDEGNTTERFLVEARANGTFKMTVTLTSEDGRLPVGPPTEVTVRSSVFSGIGAFLTIGAIAFLAGWWANHVRRGRRARRAAPADASPPPPAVDPAPAP